jgi:hypothetical protein
LVVDTSNGQFYHSDAGQTSWIDGLSGTNFVASITGYFPNGQQVYFNFWGKEYSTGHSYANGTHYLLQIYADAGGLQFKKVVSGVATVIGGTSGSFTGGIHTVKLTVIGTTFTATMDTGQTITVTDASISPGGYFGMGRLRNNTEYISNLIIDTLESTSNNGVAYTLGGVSHGARYGTQEEVYRTTTSASQLNARLNCNLISPNYASANCQWYYENITDSTSVDVDTVTKTVTITMSASPEAESRSTLVLGSGDIGDTIKFAIRRKDYSGTSYDNQPAVLVDSNLKFTGTLTVTDSVNATDLITSRIRTTLSDSVAATDAITSRLRHTFTDSVNATDLITSRLRTTQSDSVNATDLVLSRLRTTVTDSVGLSDVAYSHLFAYVILHNYLTRTVVQHNQLRG